MNKKVEDLVPGDVLVQDGVRFIVKEIAPLSDGKTAVFFEDMPASDEVATSFRRLTEITGGTGLLPPVRVTQTGWQNSKLRQMLTHNYEEIMKSHLKGVGKMEAREWMYIAVAWGRRLRGNMVPNKAYLYELNTETFVQFDSKEYAEAFIEWARTHIDHWGHDPIALLDTSDPEVRERWKGHMAKQEAGSDKIMLVSEFETGLGTELGHQKETFAPGEMQLGSMRWWWRTPMRKEEMAEVIVVVEGGMVSDVFSNVESIMVSVLDTDTDDAERESEINEERAALQAKIDAGELKSIL